MSRHGNFQAITEIRAKKMRDHFKKESYLYSSFESSSVQCLTCWRKCKINDGNYGFCRTRVNIKGVLYSIIYGMISSLSINPIEKKPLFHYFPGTRALTAGSYSCNFTCPWCQNHDISKKYPADVQEPRHLPVEELVKQAEENPQGYFKGLERKDRRRWWWRRRKVFA